MNGFYLYCIREKQNAPFAADGLYAHDQAFSLRFQNLEAIVSKVPLDELESGQIQRKAQEDLNWIKEMAQRHEAVIEQAMRMGAQIHSVIPMRFGTVFLTRENVEQTLENQYQHYSECLMHLRHKQEWCVKLFWVDRAPFTAEVGNDSQIQRRKKEIESMPRGMAYFFQSQINDLITKSVSGRCEACAGSIFEALAPLACAKLRGKILEKELTGRTEPMILNAIYLIFEDQLSAFKEAVAQHQTMLKAQGVQLACTGPWPPYHFAGNN